MRFTIFSLLLVLSVLVPMAALGGDLDSPALPTDTTTGKMHNLEDIYSRVNLKAILTLKVLAGINAGVVHTDADVNGDKRIGLEEAVYILLKMSDSPNQQGSLEILRITAFSL